MALTPEQNAECGCAFVLQKMTKRLRPAVNRAYDAPDHESRLKYVSEAILDARAVLAVLESLVPDGS